MQALYTHRSWVAGTSTLSMLALALLFASSARLPQGHALVQTPVQLDVIALPPDAPPIPPPAVAAPRPPSDVPPTASVVAPLTPPLESATVVAPAPPAPGPVPAPATPPAIVTPAPAAAEVSHPPPAPSSAAVEADFVARLRAQLDAAKRYPSGREASLQKPQGTARVWFVLARDGRLVDLGIDDSSNSFLLDNAALATVRRGVFPPLPAAAWAGQDTHRFSVDLRYWPAA